MKNLDLTAAKMAARHSRYDDHDTHVEAALPEIGKALATALHAEAAKLLANGLTSADDMVRANQISRDIMLIEILCGLTDA